VRSVSIVIAGELGSLLIASVSRPRAAMSINASAKFFDGMYDGRSPPRANIFGTSVGFAGGSYLLAKRL
jgi:hypothetical protein